MKPEAKPLAFEERADEQGDAGFVVLGICALFGLYAFVQYMEVLL